MNALLRRWYREDVGQDLIEYVLLASFIALVGVLGVQLLGSNMNSVYRSWDAATQDPALVEMPDPAGS